MTKNEQLRTLPLVGGKWRGDCIFCGGKNTLSVTLMGARLLYHCYRMGCVTKTHKGQAVRRKLSSNEIQDFFSLPGDFDTRRAITTISKEYDMPSWFVPIERHVEVFSIVKKYHCWEPYRNGELDIRWDEKQGRIVFIIYEDQVYKGTPIDATGRIFPLASTRGPKWWRYTGNGSHMLLGRGTNTCTIVEDCFSLGAVLSMSDCLCILGTHFTYKHFEALLDYNEVIIMLDPDAVKASMEIQAKLDPFIKTRVVLTPDDPKYLAPSVIKELIRG